MKRYLVVCHQTAASRQLGDHVRAIVQRDPEARFSIVVPTAPLATWRTWDEGEALALARQNASHARQTLSDAGATIERVIIGARDPLAAIEDELRDHPGYDELIVSTLPPGISRWLKLDLVNRARNRTGLPVTHVQMEPPPASPGWFGVEVDRSASAQAAPQTLEARIDDHPAQAETVAAGAATSVALADPDETAGFGRPGTLRWVRTYIGEETVATMPLAPPAPAVVDPGVTEAWQRLHEGQGVSALFAELARSPALLDGYVTLLNRIWEADGIDPVTREITILRIARDHRFSYLWHEHVAIARSLGIEDARIAAVEHWRSAEHIHFDPRERAVLGFVDAFTHRASNLEAARSYLAEFVTPPELTAIALMAGFYHATGQFAEAMRLEPAEHFVGWDLY